MGGRVRPAGLLLGLVGNALIAIALFKLIQTGSCGDLGQAACPDEVVPYVLALPAGIILSVVAIFLGGGALVFCGVFLAVGLGSMAASAFGDSEETETFGWVFGAMFTLFGLAPLLIGAALRPAAARKVAKAQRLIATGGQGVGTVTAVRDTGMTINDNPRVEVTMRVEPVDGSPAFDRSKTVTISRVAIPRTGDRFPVWYDRADPETWAFGTDMEPEAPPEVQAAFARARRPEPAYAAASATPPAPAAPEPAMSPLDELGKLNELRMAGALTDEEFAVAKDRILARLAGGATA